MLPFGGNGLLPIMPGLLRDSLDSRDAPLSIVHVASGDLWAGAEAQIVHLLCALRAFDDISLSAVVLNDGELARRLRLADIMCLVIDERRCNAVQLYRAMVAFFRERQPDIVHTHRMKENVLGAFAARAAGIGVCLRTEHGSPEHAPKIWQLYKHVVRYTDRRVARALQQRTVAVSDELANSILASDCRRNVTVIPNGIDVSEVLAQSKSAIALDPGRNHVAFIGRLVAVKRVDVFLRTAHEIICRGRRDFLFHVIGDGPLRQMLEQLRDELGLQAYCVFHGFQSNTASWLSKMRCLVLTSDHEGLPMTALEARALCIPIVAHAVGGIPALLDGQPDCRLLSTQDVNSFADSIISATDSRWGAPTPPCLPLRYHSAACATDYRQLYRDLAAQRCTVR